MKYFLILFLSALSLNSFAQNAAHACSSSKIKGFNHLHNQNSRELSDMDNYDVKFLKLEMNVSNTTTYIEGKSTQLVQVVVPNMTQFVFELHEDLNITEAKINNVLATVQRTGNEVMLEAGTLHNLNDLVSLEVAYSGNPPSSAAFNGETGIYTGTSPSWSVDATWTLSEPFFAHTWWPAKQVLTDKIDSTELIFTCDDDLKVGSNGILVNEESLPGSKTKFTWKSNYLIDYYLVSFAVAPYQDYSYKILPVGATDSLLIQNFIYDVPNYLNFFEADILETGEMMFLLSDLYGDYPFMNEKYGHCIAPLNGGMEHQTMTTQGFFANWLTVHELGHQWWGNNVTCATWGDIWINEGFASYSEYLYFQNQSQADADTDMNDRHQNIKTQDGGSLYVYDITDSDRIFNSRLTYNKGAAVVHMLRNYINNDSLFFHTLQSFQDNFSGSTCSTSQFENYFTQETAIDMNDFIDSWVYGEGYPIYSGSYNSLNDTIYIQIEQESSVSGSLMTYPSSMEMLITFVDGTDTLLRVENADSTENYLFPISKTISSITLDPSQWILKSTLAFTEDENLYFEYISSIEDEFELEVSFNNPVSNNLVIELDDNKNVNVSIYNLNGEFILSRSLKASTSIDTKNWSKGLYLLRFEKQNKTYTSKVLKL